MEQDKSPASRVEEMIYIIRGQRVMLDSDLAALYGVKTKELNRAVSRNRERFPADFVFLLAAEEVTSLRFQIGTSSSGYGGRRYRPYAFTEQGVAMKPADLRCVVPTCFGRRGRAPTLWSVGRRATSHCRRHKQFGP